MGTGCPVILKFQDNTLKDLYCKLINEFKITYMKSNPPPWQCLLCPSQSCSESQLPSQSCISSGTLSPSQSWNSSGALLPSQSSNSPGTLSSSQSWNSSGALSPCQSWNSSGTLSPSQQSSLSPVCSFSQGKLATFTHTTTVHCSPTLVSLPSQALSLHLAYAAVVSVLLIIIAVLLGALIIVWRTRAKGQ